VIGDLAGGIASAMGDLKELKQDVPGTVVRVPGRRGAWAPGAASGSRIPRLFLLVTGLCYAVVTETRSSAVSRLDRSCRALGTVVLGKDGTTMGEDGDADELA
jgi:hypothetical protein